MSVFFLGGHHCPDLHKLIIDPFLFIYYYFLPLDISTGPGPLWGGGPDEISSSTLRVGDDISFNIYLFSNFYSFLSSYFSVPFFDISSLNFNYFTLFSNKDIVFDSVSLFIDKLYGSYIFGIKIIFVVFFFIWVRASFPRLRYDQLMSLCWKELLPLVFAYIIFSICLFYSFDIIPFGYSF